MLKNKTIILGVTGSIAAYKIASLASALVKLRADVHVIMTKNACNFINPITFETLTSNRTLVDTFDRNFEFDVAHVSLAKIADVVLIAPASANVIGKLAGGIADDMLTTTVMACRCKKIVSPTMNTGMYENPVLKDNLKRLKGFGYRILEPAVGYLACGDTGAGKMPEPETLLEHIIMECAHEKDFSGKSFLVTSGATIEPIDPVRYITNHSTGKMGCAIARAALMRGARVKYVCTATALRPDETIDGLEIINVGAASDMKAALEKHIDEADVLTKDVIGDFFDEFMLFGCMPGLLPISDDDTKVIALSDIYDSIIVNDIISRYSIQNVDLFKRFSLYLMNSMGQTFSKTSITKYLKNEVKRTSRNTISNFTSYLCESLFCQIVRRQDILGKNILKTEEKYYLADHGFHHALVDDNSNWSGRILENIVYNELVRRRYTVKIGKIGDREIDFVCSKHDNKIYIQVAYLLSDDEVIDREFTPLLNVPDKYDAYVLSLDPVDMSRNGIKHKNIIDFLLDDEI